VVVGSEGNPVQAGQASRVLGELAHLLGVAAIAPSHAGQIQGTDAMRTAAARAWLRCRRLRETALGADLFSDPAWDMLLDLYIEHQAGRAPAVSSLCLASHAPATTALRWIGRLEGDGLVTRTPDATDGRRIYIRIVPATVEALDRLMDSYIQAHAHLFNAAAL
jgi:DNA-binding MarR family transcriptional regulator